MPVVPTTAYSEAEDALSLARALMNDSSAAVFTDALLMPLLNSAYRGLQRELAENGVSVLTEQQDLDLEPDPLSGVTNTEISDTSSPQLPSDCLMPQMLWERAAANTADTFVPMEKFTSGGSMLNLQPSTYLRLWEWREDKINLVGATQAVTVRVRFEKVLPALTTGTDPVQIRAATDPLAFATAALAARSRSRAGSARGRAARHRKSHPALRPPRADQRPPPQTLQLPPPRDLSVGEASGCLPIGVSFAGNACERRLKPVLPQHLGSCCRSAAPLTPRPA